MLNTLEKPWFPSLSISHLQADVTKEVLQLHCEHNHPPTWAFRPLPDPPHSVWLLALLFHFFQKRTLTIQCTMAQL